MSRLYQGRLHDQRKPVAYAGRRDIKSQKGGDSMTPERFEALREEFLTHEARFPVWKRGEYSPDEDILQNFRKVAESLGFSVEEALAYKALRLVMRIVRAVKTGKYAWAWETEDGEGLKQRIADARDFLLLLAALLEEKNDNEVGGRGKKGTAPR